MRLKIKRLRPGAVLPRRATPESAGLDLCACLEQELTIHPFELVRVPTGLAIQLEPGTVGLVYARSGLASKFGVTLSNCVGVIDSDYRGELQVAMTNHSQTPYTIRPGDRLAIVGLNGAADFYAADLEGLKREGKISLEVFLEVCAEKGIAPKKQAGRFALRLDPETYQSVAIAASASGKSINQFIVDSLKQSVQAV